MLTFSLKRKTDRATGIIYETLKVLVLTAIPFSLMFTMKIINPAKKNNPDAEVMRRSSPVGSILNPDIPALKMHAIR